LHIQSIAIQKGTRNEGWAWPGESAERRSVWLINRLRVERQCMSYSVSDAMLEIGLAGTSIQNATLLGSGSDPALGLAGGAGGGSGAKAALLIAAFDAFKTHPLGLFGVPPPSNPPNSPNDLNPYKSQQFLMQ